MNRIKTLLGVIICAIWLYPGIVSCQNALIYRSSDADSIWHKAYYLQSGVTSDKPVVMSSPGDGNFQIQFLDEAGIVKLVNMYSPTIATYYIKDSSSNWSMYGPPYINGTTVIAHYLPQISGTVEVAHVSVIKTTSYTMGIGSKEKLILMDATLGVDTTFLPLTSEFGQSYASIMVKKVDASGNAVRIKPKGSDTIEGAAIYTLATQYKMVHLMSNYNGISGSIWYITAIN